MGSSSSTGKVEVLSDAEIAALERKNQNDYLLHLKEKDGIFLSGSQFIVLRTAKSVLLKTKDITRLQATWVTFTRLASLRCLTSEDLHRLMGLCQDDIPPAIHILIRDRNTEALAEAISRRGDFDVEAADGSGTTPLISAISANSHGCVAVLLTGGASLRRTDKYGNLPLHVAAISGSRECLRALIDHHAPLEEPSSCGDTPFIAAVRVDNIRNAVALLEFGAHARATNARQYDHEAIHVAAQIGATKCLEVLLTQARVPVDVRAAGDGCTPLHLACGTAGGASAVLPLLNAGADALALIPSNAETAAHIAARSHNDAALQALVRAAGYRAIVTALDRAGNTPLHNAARAQDVDCMKILCGAGDGELRSIGLELANARGETPLRLASNSDGCLRLLLEVQVRQLRVEMERLQHDLTLERSAAAAARGDGPSAPGLLDELRETQRRYEEAQQQVAAGERDARRLREALEQANIELVRERAKPSAPPPDRMSGVPVQVICTICMDAPIEVAMVPCGHLCTCRDCSASLTACPMCRARVTSKLRVYQS